MKLMFKAALAGAVALTVSTGAAFSADVTLRCQHFLSPKGSVPLFFMEPWAKKVEKDSGGRIKVELYPAMQLGGKPPALYDQIRDGVIDCGWALPAYTPGRFPGAATFELPFLTSTSAENSSKAAWDFTQKYLMKEFADVHLLAVHVHGPGVVFKKGAPVKTLADFKGLKLRGPSRLANAMLEKLGATPVGMPVPAFPEALSKGVVDGGVIPWEVAPGLKITELANSATQIGGAHDMYNTFFLWAMNKAVYDKLPDDLKKVMDDNSGLATSAWAGRAMDEGDKLGLADGEKQKMDIYTMDDTERAGLEKIGAEVTADWVAETTKLGLPAQQMIDDAKALIVKYSN